MDEHYMATIRGSFTITFESFALLLLSYARFYFIGRQLCSPLCFLFQWHVEEINFLECKKETSLAWDEYELEKNNMKDVSVDDGQWVLDSHPKSPRAMCVESVKR